MITLVVGGNRGIGLALVKEQAKRDPTGTIFATTRNPSDSADLDAIVAEAEGRIIIVQLDTVDEASVKAAAATITKHTSSLDRLIINSGVALGGGPIENLDPDVLLENFRANVVGPHNIFRAFSPLVLASTSAKRDISVTSSLLGSTSTIPVWGPGVRKSLGSNQLPITSYAVSKSAVNNLSRYWADTLEPKGVPVIAIHPGLVATRMSKGMDANAITPEASALGYIDILDKIDIKKTSEGIFSYDGSVIAW